MRFIALLLTVFLTLGFSPQRTEAAAHVAGAVLCGPLVVGCAAVLMVGAVVTYTMVRDQSSGMDFLKSEGIEVEDISVKTVGTEEEIYEDAKRIAMARVEGDSIYGDPESERWYLVGKKVPISKKSMSETMVEEPIKRLLVFKVGVRHKVVKEEIKEHAELNVRKGPFTLDNCLREMARIKKQFRVPDFRNIVRGITGPIGLNTGGRIRAPDGDVFCQPYDDGGHFSDLSVQDSYEQELDVNDWIEPEGGSTLSGN